MTQRLIGPSVLVTASLFSSIGFGQGQAGIPVAPGPARPVYVTNLPETQNVYVTNLPEGVEIQPVTLEFRARATDTPAGPTFLFSDLDYTVPEGTRLVIEYVDVSAWLGNAANTGQLSVDLFAVTSGTFFRHPIGIAEDEIACTLSQACLYLNRQLKVYVEAGFHLRADALIIASTATSFGHILQGTVNGYLESLPTEAE